MVLKYTHRLKAVFFDATHHLSIGKCNSNNNKNSEKKKRSRRQVPQSTSQPLTMTRHSMPELARRSESGTIDRSLFGMDMDRFDVAGFDDFVEPGVPESEVTSSFRPDVERGQVTFSDRIMGEERKQFLRLERECQMSTKAILNSRHISNCWKVQKWRNRLDHLLGDLTKMKNVCLKKQIDN